MEPVFAPGSRRSPPGDGSQQLVLVATPPPRPRQQLLGDLIDDEPNGVSWHSSYETARLLDMMTDINRAKVDRAGACGHRTVGTIYRRMRSNGRGGRIQRAEVRFDGVAGCLRTPQGGSSRQTVMVVNGDEIRSRLLSPREAARLMGLNDSYKLPKNYNDAYRLAGDGVAVPVVRHLSQHLLEPLLAKDTSALQPAA